MEESQIRYCQKCKQPIAKKHWKSMSQYSKRRFCNRACQGNPVKVEKVRKISKVVNYPKGSYQWHLSQHPEQL